MAEVIGVPESFEIAVDNTVPDDLHRHPAATRLVGEMPGASWQYGAERSFMKGLIDCRYGKEHEEPSSRPGVFLTFSLPLG